MLTALVHPAKTEKPEAQRADILRSVIPQINSTSGTYYTRLFLCVCLKFYTIKFLLYFVFSMKPGLASYCTVLLPKARGLQKRGKSSFFFPSRVFRCSKNQDGGGVGVGERLQMQVWDRELCGKSTKRKSFSSHSGLPCREKVAHSGWPPEGRLEFCHPL